MEEMKVGEHRLSASIAEDEHFHNGADDDGQKKISGRVRIEKPFHLERKKLPPRAQRQRTPRNQSKSEIITATVTRS